MAVVGSSLPTLADLQRMRDPNGQFLRIVNSLAKASPIVQDAVWKEANGDTGHTVGTQLSLPSVGWTSINEGVPRSKASTGQYTEPMGLLTGQMAIDRKLVDMNGGAEYRARQEEPWAQAFRHELETTFFYGDPTTAPKKPGGMAPRLDTISGGTHANQIVPVVTGASGSDQTSIWLVGWGEDKVYCTYPRGSMAGLKRTDIGLQMINDAGGTNQYSAYITEFEWKLGFVVEDYRYLVRCPNADTGSGLTATGTTILDAMLKAANRIQSTEDCKPVFYVNRTIREYLMLQARTAVASATLRFEDIAGRPQLTAHGIPVRLSEHLLNTESTVA